MKIWINNKIIITHKKINFMWKTLTLTMVLIYIYIYILSSKTSNIIINYMKSKYIDLANSFILKTYSSVHNPHLWHNTSNVPMDSPQPLRACRSFRNPKIWSMNSWDSLEMIRQVRLDSLKESLPKTYLGKVYIGLRA